MCCCRTQSLPQWSAKRLATILAEVLTDLRPLPQSQRLLVLPATKPLAPQLGACLLRTLPTYGPLAARWLLPPTLRLRLKSRASLNLRHPGILHAAGVLLADLATLRVYYPFLSIFACCFSLSSAHCIQWSLCVSTLAAVITENAVARHTPACEVVHGLRLWPDSQNEREIHCL